MKLLVAADEQWGIGKNGDLLWHLRADMDSFKEKTIGHVVVMGRKTLDSFPGGKPLKNRVNLVLTRDPGFSREGAVILYSTAELFEKLKEYPEEEVFLIGGGSLYKELLPYCDTAYVTKVHAVKEADTFFPNLDEDPQWSIVEEKAPIEENGVIYHFTTYQRTAG